MKTCIRCKKVKDYERFQVAPQNKDNYASTCYDCVAHERNLRKHNGATKVCQVCSVFSIGNGFALVSSLDVDCVGAAYFAVVHDGVDLCGLCLFHCV